MFSNTVKFRDSRFLRVSFPRLISSLPLSAFQKPDSPMFKICSLPRLLLATVTLAFCSLAGAQAPKAVDASAATPKTGNARFFELHESFLKRGKSGPIGVLFLGDSITEGWT